MKAKEKIIKLLNSIGAYNTINQLGGFDIFKKIVSQYPDLQSSFEEGLSGKAYFSLFLDSGKVKNFFNFVIKGVDTDYDDFHTLMVDFIIDFNNLSEDEINKLKSWVMMLSLDLDFYYIKTNDERFSEGHTSLIPYSFNGEKYNIRSKRLDVTDEEIYDILTKTGFFEKKINESIQYLNENIAYKKGYTFSPSTWLKTFIKNEEGDAVNKGQPVLKAYEIAGDLTIGYGHTTGDVLPAVNSGMKITNKQAEEILNNDLSYSANCVRRIFKEWEDKGIEVSITQNMFDVLVSLTFNAGCGSIRTSDFIQSIKRKKFKTAAKQIKNFNVMSGYKGLINRRNQESEKFLS